MSPQPKGDTNTSLLAHTDFGSVTLLWNVIGGLQILPPGCGDSDPDGVLAGWQYVKPEKGCIVVNMGDAMPVFSGGRIRSNLHRVTAAPGEQGSVVRYSVAYFMRPEDDVLMKCLGDEDGQKTRELYSAFMKRLGEENGNADKLFRAREWVAMKSDAYRSGVVMQSSGGE